MAQLHEVTWFAGLFEGEGCFTFSNGKPKQMTVQMTDLDVLKRVESLFGGSIWEAGKQKPHHKNSWKWRISGAKSVALAQDILPYLGERRSERCVEYINNYRTLEAKRDRENSKFEEMMRLRELGLTHKEIGDRLGIERSSVTHTFNRHGVRSIKVMR